MPVHRKRGKGKKDNPSHSAPVVVNVIQWHGQENAYLAVLCDGQRRLTSVGTANVRDAYIGHRR